MTRRPAPVRSIPAVIAAPSDPVPAARASSAHRRPPRRNPGGGPGVRAAHRRRDRGGHDQVPNGSAFGVVGEAVSTHHPVRAGAPWRQDRQRQPVSQRGARRGSRRGRSAPTPSSAHAIGASSSGVENSKPWWRWPAPSWSWYGACWPTLLPASTTSAVTTTPAVCTPNVSCATIIAQLAALGYRVTVEPAA